MAEKYPSSLPQPVRDNYAGSPLVPKTRVQMDDGHYFDRRQWGAQPFKYNLTWHFTTDQLAFFEAWFEYQVLRMSGWFETAASGKLVNVRPTTGELKVDYRLVGWTVGLEVMEIRAAPVLPTPIGLPLWPSNLPELESDGYTYARKNSYTVSDIENAGLADVRQRFRWTLTQWESKIYVSPEERDDFWDFYRDTLADGVAWFQIEFDNGMGKNTIRSRFAALPVESPVGSWYQITMKLESAKVPMLTENEYNSRRPFVNDYVEAGYVIDGYVGYYTD